MRNRHFPRLCRSCEAPMACQEDTCWNCGEVWDHHSEERNALRVVPGSPAGSPNGVRQSHGQPALVGASPAGRVRP